MTNESQQEVRQRKERTLREQQGQGERAELVLKALAPVFEQLEKDCFSTFRKSDIHDDRGRATCRIYLRILDDVKERFEQQVRTGAVASRQLVEIKPKPLLKRITSG